MDIYIFFDLELLYCEWGFIRIEAVLTGEAGFRGEYSPRNGWC